LRRREVAVTSAAVAASLVVALVGVGVAASSRRTLRRRLELVAGAEHELRGPAAALSLACEGMARDPRAEGHSAVLEAQLDRLRAGLADLEAARRGGRSNTRPEAVDLLEYTRATVAAWRTSVEASLEWKGGRSSVPADRGRLAQVLGNLIANAVEHGDGRLEVRGRRVPHAVTVEVRNNRRSEAPPRTGGDRGRGLAIASAAARELGGRLLVETRDRAHVAVLELPDPVTSAEAVASERELAA
jgi:signal transduction histidine kinase